MKPNLPMYRNFLAVYPYILEHLAKVPGVRKVLEAHDLEQLTRDKKVKPIDGAVFVVFDGFTPLTEAGKKRWMRERLSFSLILCKRHYNPNRGSYGEDGVGETLTAIKSAFQGFDPVDEHGQALVTSPFESRQAMPITYHEGFAFFPVRFETVVSIQFEGVVS